MDISEHDRQGISATNLAGLNATAPVLRARHGQIDLRYLFDGGLYNPLTKSPDVQSWLGAASIAHEHAHSSRDIEAYTILRREPIRAVALTLFLRCV